MKLKLLIAALAFPLLSSLSACSEGAGAEAGKARGRIVDSAGGTVALGIRKLSYRPSAPGPGSVSGAVRLQGEAPDSVVAVAKDAEVCGDSAHVHEVVARNGLLENALVWVDGITAGKPLPQLRRQTLTIDKCRFEPRIMGVVTGSTINVFSNDRVEHGPRFYREGASDPVAEIQTVDAGQVVPSEKIASAPGIVEVRCHEHPFARAYIAVFDHPYFAVTDEHGAFEIDGLPAGTYTVKVWHERLAKPVEQRVVVGPGGSGKLDVQLNLSSAMAANSSAR
jgi:hypothetical protein